MKALRTFIVSSAIALCSVHCHGQAALLVALFGEKLATENFHLSIDIGMNVTSLPGLEQQSALTGLNFGMGTFIKLNDKWSLTPEFKPISRAGARGVTPLITDIEILDPESKFVFNYIDVPVLAQYRFAKGFSLAAGPQISFLTMARQETEGNLLGGKSIVLTYDIKSYMNNVNLSIPVQLSYSLVSPRGGKGINFKVRYNISTQEVFSDTEFASSNNSRWQFILSFPYTLGGED